MDSAHRRNPLLFDLMPAGPRRVGRGSGWRRSAAGRFFPGAVCSPLPAKPYGSVSGSKIFTQFPRPRSAPAAFSRARFAPSSPLGLVLPSRGANSSHNSRALAGRRSLPFFRARVGCPPISGGRAVSGRSDRGPVAGASIHPKNPRSAFRFGDFSFTFIFLYLSISSRWDSGVRK